MSLLFPNFYYKQNTFNNVVKHVRKWYFPCALRACSPKSDLCPLAAQRTMGALVPPFHLLIPLLPESVDCYFDFGCGSVTMVFATSKPVSNVLQTIRSPHFWTSFPIYFAMNVHMQYYPLFISRYVTEVFYFTPVFHSMGSWLQSFQLRDNMV